MPLGPIRWLQAAWAIGRQLEQSLALSERTDKTINGLEERLRSVEDRLLTIQAQQLQLIVEAKSAAAGAVAALATRLALPPADTL